MSAAGGAIAAAEALPRLDNPADIAGLDPVEAEFMDSVIAREAQGAPQGDEAPLESGYDLFDMGAADGSIMDPRGWSASTPGPDLPEGMAPAEGSFEYSHSGLPGGRDRAEQLFGEARGRGDQAAAGIRDEYQARFDAHEQNFNERSMLMQEEAEELKQHNAEMMGLHKRRMDFETTSGEVYRDMHLNAQREAQQYMGQFKQELAGLRTLMQSSGNPLADLSGLQGAGLAAAAGVQALLKVTHGVDIGVQQTIDRWVEREMESHQNKIKNQRAFAQDHLTLVDLARQNAADDYEAFQRTRAFTIAAMQQQVQIEGLRFNSAIATNHAQQRAMELEGELNKTLDEMTDKMVGRITTARGQEYDAAAAQGKLELEQEELRLKERLATMKAARAGGMKKPKPERPVGYVLDAVQARNQDGTPMADPEGNPVYERLYRVDPNLPEETKRKVEEQVEGDRAAYDQYDVATTEMMTLWPAAKKEWDKLSAASRSELGKIWGDTSGWENASRWDSTGAIALYNQAVSQWVMAKVFNMSGKAATEGEQKRHAELARPDKLIEKGSKTEKIQAALRAEGRRAFVSKVGKRMHVLPVPKEERFGYGINRPSREHGAQDDAILKGEKPKTSVASAAYGRVAGKDTDKIMRSGEQVSTKWLEYRGLTVKPSDKDSEDVKRYYAEQSGQPEYAVRIEQLAGAYLYPKNKSLRQSLGATDELDADQAKAQALANLRRIADNTDGSIPTEAQLYAIEIESDLVNRPDGLRKKLLPAHGKTMKPTEMGVYDYAGEANFEGVDEKSRKLQYQLDNAEAEAARRRKLKR